MGKTKLKYSEHIQNCVKVKGASSELKAQLMNRSIYNKSNQNLNRRIYVDSSAICAYIHEHTNIFCEEQPSEVILKYYHKIINGDIRFGDEVKMTLGELIDLFGSYDNIPIGVYREVK